MLRTEKGKGCRVKECVRDLIWRTVAFVEANKGNDDAIEQKAASMS